MQSLSPHRVTKDLQIELYWNCNVADSLLYGYPHFLPPLPWSPTSALVHSCTEESQSSNLNENALCNVGWMLQFGQGLPMDVAAAIKSYEMAMMLGSASAVNNLAVCYLKGVGVQADKIKAINLFNQARNMGSPMAQVNLAVCYWFGFTECFESSHRMLAFRWLLEPARKHHPQALQRVVDAYEKGWGVHVDMNEALKWAALAVRCGVAMPASKMEELLVGVLLMLISEVKVQRAQREC